MINTTDLRYKVVQPMRPGFAKAGWNYLKKSSKKKTGTSLNSQWQLPKKASKKK